MSVARHTEITASGAPTDEAIQNGVERASQTFQNIEHVWVKEIKARVEGRKISE